ncbi:LysR family transcriptional regulator [Streptomyces sp. AcH 505]|jgi:DNA-binding transcriptional LysR family regulator|uniref:LysR substrate-binding domain-containing protein n=1 Tax=Streptomyces sp. AcH 505 TaxID=352211 RepID=UPI00099D91E9
MNHLSCIRVFKRVVELGSFTKAAEELRISQSSATKQVSQLEQHLGARLLNRNTRGISITEDGAIYYDSCKGILADVEYADSIVGERSKSLAGTLHISTSVAFGRRVLAPLLMEFMGSQPQLKVDLVCNDDYVDLVTHGVDVALRMGRLSDSSLGCRYITHNPWVMVAAPGYLAGRSEPRCPADLKHHECIVYSSVQGDAVWQLRSKAGVVQTVAVKGSLRSNNLSALLSATIVGFGIAILPRYVASAALSTGDIVPIMETYSVPGQDLHAVFPSSKQVSSKALAFTEFLLPRFRANWWDGRPHACEFGKMGTLKPNAHPPYCSEEQAVKADRQLHTARPGRRRA